MHKIPNHFRAQRKTTDAHLSKSPPARGKSRLTRRVNGRLDYRAAKYDQLLRERLTVQGKQARPAAEADCKVVRLFMVPGMLHCGNGTRAEHVRRCHGTRQT